MRARLIANAEMVKAAAADERGRIANVRVLLGEGPIPAGFVQVKPGRTRGEYVVEADDGQVGK